MKQHTGSEEGEHWLGYGREIGVSMNWVQIQLELFAGRGIQHTDWRREFPS